MITIEEISEKICNYYQIPEFVLTTKTRKREYVLTRQVIWYYCKLLTKMPLWLMGSYFNRDHATSLYGIRVINNLIETDKKFAKQINEIQKLFRNKEQILNDLLLKIKELITKRILKKEAKRQYEQQIAFEQLSKMIDEEIKQII